MTIALAERPDTWAVQYAAATAGPPVYADTVRATGLDPAEARAVWATVTAWRPWWPEPGPAHDGYRVGQR